MGGLERVDRALPPLFAVIGTVAVVLVFLALFGNDGEASSADPTTAPSGTATGTSTATRTPTATVTPPASTPTPSPTATPVKAPVTVLNNSRISGLAGRVADELRAGGWQVPSVGNYTGRVATTTVYYPPGLEAAAESLVAQFPKLGGIDEAVDGLRDDRLTVILASTYQE